MNAVQELSRGEKRAYELIASNDEEMYQSDLWKALNANSRKGSKLASGLEAKGLIERQEATHNGQRTYLLTITDEKPTEDLADQDTTQSKPSPDEPSLEDRALAFVKDRGGLYQSQLWKELDVSSRKGSRIATSLADDGLIRRESATYNGQRTYLLLPARRDLDFSLLMAGDMISPLIGAEGDVDPIDSDHLTQWILQLASQ